MGVVSRRRSEGPTDGVDDWKGTQHNRNERYVTRAWMGSDVRNAMREWWHETPMLAAWVTACVILATLLLLARSRLRKKRRDTILICGPSGAGKTALFYGVLKPGTLVDTVTSMQENVGQVQWKTPKNGASTIAVVDLPGNPSLRFLLQKYAPQCKGVVFVVDSVDFLTNVTLAAEHLLDILLHRDIAGPKVPILVACNKAERVTAHGVDFLRKRLEKEVEKLKTTKMSLLEDKATKQLVSGLGKTDKYFSFADCRNKVEFAKVSVYKGDIASVQKFIQAVSKR